MLDEKSPLGVTGMGPPLTTTFDSDLQPLFRYQISNLGTALSAHTGWLA